MNKLHTLDALSLVRAFEHRLDGLVSENMADLANSRRLGIHEWGVYVSQVPNVVPRNVATIQARESHDVTLIEAACWLVAEMHLKSSECYAKVKFLEREPTTLFEAYMGGASGELVPRIYYYNDPNIPLLHQGAQYLDPLDLLSAMPIGRGYV